MPAAEAVRLVRFGAFAFEFGSRHNFWEPPLVEFFLSFLNVFYCTRIVRSRGTSNKGVAC